MGRLLGPLPLLLFLLFHYFVILLLVQLTLSSFLTPLKLAEVHNCIVKAYYQTRRVCNEWCLQIRKVDICSNYQKLSYCWTKFGRFLSPTIGEINRINISIHLTPSYHLLEFPSFAYCFV